MKTKGFADHEIIKERATADAYNIITRYYPNARHQGKDIRFSVDGGRGDGCSFDTVSGTFTGFSAGVPPTDIIGFIVWAQGSGDPRDPQRRIAVFDQLRPYYGDNGDGQTAEHLQAAVQQRKERKGENEAHKAAQRSAAVMLYAEAAPIDGTPGVDYFIGRGGVVDRVPENLRWHRAVPLPGKRNGTHQALVMPLTTHDGELCGIHQIYLTNEGNKHFWAPGKAKFSLGRASGTGIWLRNPQAETVAICEGPEKGWAMLQVLPDDWGVCAVPGGNFMVRLQLHDKTKHVVIMADNDPLKGPAGKQFRPGQKIAEEAARQYVKQGRTARVVLPPYEGRDWDEMLLDAAGGSPDEYWQFEADVLGMIEAAEVWRPDPVQEGTGRSAETAVAETKTDDAVPAVVCGEETGARSDTCGSESASSARGSTDDSRRLHPLDPELGLKLIPDELKARLEHDGLSVSEYLAAVKIPADPRLTHQKFLQENWVYVIDEECWFAEGDGEELKRSAKGMQAAYGKTVPPPASNATAEEKRVYRALKRATGISAVALAHPRTIIAESTASIPGKRTLIWDRDRVAFNRWRYGWIQPVSRGDYRHDLVQLWLDVLYAACAQEPNGEQIFDYVLNWMAMKLQQRAIKMPTAIYITGASGIGKTMIIFEPLVQILGEHNAAILLAQDLDSRFTASWAQMELVVIDEAEAGLQAFEKGTGRSAKGKQAITDRRIKKEGKGIEATFIVNHTSWCFCSNYSTGVLIEDQNRRYLVIGCRIVTADHKSRIPRYWAYINGKEKNTDIDPRKNPRAKQMYANIYRYLLDRDISEFDPRELPESAAAVRVAKFMKPGFWQLLDRLYEEQEEPFERAVVSIAEIRIVLAAHRFPGVSDGEILAWLEAKHAINHSQALKLNEKPFGPVLCHGWSVDADGNVVWREKQFRLWVIRDQNEYLDTNGDDEKSDWVAIHAKSAGHNGPKEDVPFAHKAK